MRVMKIERFEDIISWQKSKELSVSIYKMFKSDTDFGFRNQIERSSVSVRIILLKALKDKQIMKLGSFYILPKVLVGRSVQCYILQKI